MTTPSPPGKREPTPEETAAIVAALTALTSAAPRVEPAGRRRGGWADRSAGLRRPLRAGIGAWRQHR